jgi:TRAP-type C4-dicarboxylate transport system substrate-binding protein
MIAATAPLAVLAAHPAFAAEFEFKFGNISAKDTSLFTELAVPLARAIEKETGGRIAVDVRAQGGYGTPVEMIPMVESGQIDMAISVPSYHPGRFPRTSVLDLPTIFDSAERGSRIASALLQEGLVAADYKDFKVLSLFTAAPFGLLVLDDKIKGLQDLRGMRVRVSGGTIGLAFARLGTIPLGLPSNLLGAAITKDWIDAIFFSIDSARATQAVPGKSVVDLAPVLIDCNWAAPAQIALMNKKSYESLPPDLRIVIDRLTGSGFATQAGRVRDDGEIAAKRAVAAGGKHRVFTFSDKERAEINARIEPVFDEWIADMNSQGVDGATLLKRAREIAKSTAVPVTTGAIQTGAVTMSASAAGTIGDRPNAR